MFSQYIIDGIGAGIGLCIFALIPLFFGIGIHNSVMGHRKQNLRRIEEANNKEIMLKKIETGYQKDTDVYERNCFGFRYF